MAEASFLNPAEVRNIAVDAAVRKFKTQHTVIDCLNGVVDQIQERARAADSGATNVIPRLEVERNRIIDSLLMATGGTSCPNENDANDCPSCLYYVRAAAALAARMAEVMYGPLIQSIQHPVSSDCWSLEVRYCPEGVEPQIFDYQTQWLDADDGTEKVLVQLSFSPFIKEPDNLVLQHWGMTFRLFHELASHVYAHRRGSYSEIGPRSVTVGGDYPYAVFFEGWMMFVEQHAFRRILPGVIEDRRIRQLTSTAERRSIEMALEPGYRASMVTQGENARALEDGYDLAWAAIELLFEALGIEPWSPAGILIFERASAEIALEHWRDYDHAKFIQLMQSHLRSQPAYESLVEAFRASYDGTRIDPFVLLGHLG